MFSQPVPLEVDLDTAGKGVKARRLEPDWLSGQRFSDLMKGVNVGLEGGQTMMSPRVVDPNNKLPQSIQEGLIKDITSVENGFEAILHLDDKNASKHLELSNQEDSMPDFAEVMFTYTEFSTNYFVVTNYSHQKGVNTAEELQIFTKSR